MGLKTAITRRGACGCGVKRNRVRIIPIRFWADTTAKQGSSSFLKKKTKRLLLCWLMRLIRLARIKESKSFLVLFFKKELLFGACLPLAVSRSQCGLVSHAQRFACASAKSMAHEIASSGLRYANPRYDSLGYRGLQGPITGPSTRLTRHTGLPCIVPWISRSTMPRMRPISPSTVFRSFLARRFLRVASAKWWMTGGITAKPG